MRLFSSVCICLAKCTRADFLGAMGVNAPEKRLSDSVTPRRIQPLNANLACPLFYSYCFNELNCVFLPIKLKKLFCEGVDPKSKK